MAFDYKKEYKEFYLPSRKPHLITVPPMNFVTVQGKGDPNDPAGEYQAAMEVLYGLAYTIKMSYKGSHRMEGFLSMWCLRWKDCGISRVWTVWTMPTRRLLNGSP